MNQLSQSAHPAMDQKIADAIERRATSTSIITVDGRPVPHRPFGSFPLSRVVESDGTTLAIAGRTWPIGEIQSYDPATGDFVVSGRTVAVRALPRAA